LEVSDDEFLPAKTKIKKKKVYKIRESACSLLFLMLKRLVRGESLDSFLQNNQDKTVLVKFFTEWCGPCKVLQNNIKSLLTELGQTKEKKEDLVVLEIDAEKFPELAQRPEFNVYSVPTLFLFRQGKMLKKTSGSLSVPQLKDLVAVE